MKNKRLICLILALALLTSSFTAAAEETAAEDAASAAEEAALKEGTYVSEDGEPLSDELLAVTRGEKRYMPVAAVMQGLGYEVSDNGISVAVGDVVLTAGSYRVEMGGAIKIAPLPPVLEGDTLYALEILMTDIFGITVKEQNDGTIKVTAPAEGSETVEVDDSWYDEWVATRVPEPVEELTVSQLLRKNFQKSLYVDTDISSLLARMDGRGMFTDINYKDTNLTSWQPGSHVSRLGTIAKAVYNPENKHYMSEEALTKLELGIKYWFDNNFVSQNWWWNDRGIPDYFMTVAAFDPEIDPKYKKQLDEITKEQPGGSFRMLEPGKKAADNTIRPWENGEAAVPVQTAINEMIALRLPDETVEPWLLELIEYINVEFTSPPYPLNFNKTGFEYDTDQHMRGDYGYTCHNYQNLIGTYGLGILERGVEKVLDYVEGMGMKITDEAAEELTKYLTDGFRYVSYNNYYQNTILGRGAGQAGSSNKMPEYNRRIFRSIGWRFLYEYPNVTRKAELMWFLNSLNDPEYVKQFTGNKYFWQTDFLSHNRPEYQFGVHPVSERSRKPESVLNINRKGLYLGDGAYNLLKRGGEYDGIQPYRDWNKISGTTAELGQENLAPQGMGTTSFVGGATDGLYGFSVFDYDFRNVTAKKSWFCFDNEIVCLGAGITGKGNGDIYTTMNQTNLYGDIITDKTGKLDVGIHDLEGVKWVLHDGVGYVLEGTEKVNIENVTRTGTWKEIDLDSGSEEPVSGDVFIAGINHGAKPTDASYHYTIIPEADEAFLKDYVNNSKIEIVSNTKDIQAVYHKDLKILMAGFYTAGSVQSSGISVSVDKPCVVMVRQEGKDYTVSCAYPENVATTVNVNVSGNVSASLTFDLAEGFRGNDAGRTLIYDSKTDEYNYVEHKTNPITITEPAELYAIAINDEVMEAFTSKKFIYTLNVEEIPDIKAKGNFPVKIEHRENQSVIIVEEPSNPDNSLRYIINYNFINKDKE